MGNGLVLLKACQATRGRKDGELRNGQSSKQLRTFERQHVSGSLKAKVSH